MEKQSNVKMITLLDLWKVFIRNFWIIILAVALVTGGYFVYEKVTYEPRYESTATLYILRQDDKKNGNDTSDFTLALNVVTDCNYLLKSHAVIDDVIDELNLDMSYATLRSCINTSNPEGTRILEVRVESSSPKLSKEIVDAVCEIGAQKIEDAMGFQQVNLYEYGIYNESPIGLTGYITYFIIAIITAILAYTFLLLIYLFDDRITTDEEIEKHLNLHVIGDIPYLNGTRGNKYRYYKYGGRYSNDDSKNVEEG